MLLAMHSAAATGKQLISALFVNDCLDLTLLSRTSWKKKN
jgi:hypothetical protein